MISRIFSVIVLMVISFSLFGQEKKNEITVSSIAPYYIDNSPILFSHRKAFIPSEIGYERFFSKKRAILIEYSNIYIESSSRNRRLLKNDVFIRNYNNIKLLYTYDQKIISNLSVQYLGGISFRFSGYEAYVVVPVAPLHLPGFKELIARSHSYTGTIGGAFGVKLKYAILKRYIIGIGVIYLRHLSPYSPNTVESKMSLGYKF